MKFDSAAVLEKMSEALNISVTAPLAEQLKAIDKARNIIDNVYRNGFKEGLKAGSKNIEI